MKRQWVVEQHPGPHGPLRGGTETAPVGVNKSVNPVFVLGANLICGRPMREEFVPTDVGSYQSVMAF